MCECFITIHLIHSMKNHIFAGHQFLLPYWFLIYCFVCFVCSNNKLFSLFIAGLGSEVQSGWEQDCVCGWRSVNKYIWLPNLMSCFILSSVTPQVLHWNLYDWKWMNEWMLKESSYSFLSFLADFLLLVLCFDANDYNKYNSSVC